MDLIMRLAFIIGILLIYLIILYFLRKKMLTLKYSLLWIAFNTVLLVFSLFPDVFLPWLASLLGFQVASNALFALLIGFCLILLMSITAIVSQQSQRIKSLTQASALLEKRIRELEADNGSIKAAEER